MQDQTSYLSDFADYLRAEERSAGTIEKYMRDVRKFFCWLADKSLEKVQVSAWRAQLLADGYAPETVNSMIVALNRFLDFIGRSDCRVHTLRIQRKLFRSQERELTREEYEQLVQTAQRKRQERLALLLEAITATGIRVSEVKYLTVEAARAGRAELRSRVRFVSFCCRISCAASCSSMPKNKKPFPVRSFSQETGKVCPDGRSGVK